MSNDEIRDYVEQQRSASRIPYDVYSILMDEISPSLSFTDKELSIIKAIKLNGLFRTKYSNDEVSAVVSKVLKFAEYS